MLSNEVHQKCLEECLACMEACNSCFDACLNEENVNMMAPCIRLDRECSDICGFAAKAIQSNSPFMEQICSLCAEICEACADECSKHSHDHCQKCAEACRRCAAACREMISH
ncbi:MAG: four-helix bundle copper-binding protein [Bacillota bacterium]|nr:four-helix bundle copper-binding protein [Bacillota bacterium]